MGSSLSHNVIKEFGKFVGAKKKTSEENRNWWVNFLNSLGTDVAESAAYPATEMLGGMVENDLPRFAQGAGLTVGSGVANLVIPAAGRKLKEVGTKGLSKLEGALKNVLPKFADETGAAKIDAVVPKRMITMIENSGGKVRKFEDDVLHWTDKDGVKRANNINERFGARDVGTNARAQGTSLRQINEAPRQVGEDVKSLAYDAAGMSSEELQRPGVFYRMGRSGEPTYLGKKVDAGGAGGAIIEVRPGELPKIYQGSGKAADLERFRQTATGQDVLDKFYSQRGVAGGNVPAQPKKVPKVIKASQVPEIKLTPDQIKKFKLSTKTASGKNITFANNFDKAAYNLATSKKPNQQLLAELQMQSENLYHGGLDETTIMQHGHKVAQRIAQKEAAGEPLKLTPRSIKVIREAEVDKGGKKLVKTILGAPSALKFSLDLPWARQSLQANLLHPIETGLPALKRAFGSYSEKGFGKNVADLAETSPLHDLLDTATAIGPSKSQELFPNIDELKKLGVSDVPEYFTGTDIFKDPNHPIIKSTIGDYLVNPSARSYEMSQMVTRANELNRIAKSMGKSVFDLAKDETLAPEVTNIVRKISDFTGRGGLGPAEKAGDILSYGMTAPRNLAAKFHRNNPLNYLPSKAYEKLGEGLTSLTGWDVPERALKGAVDYGAAGRYGSGAAYKDFITDRAKWAALMGVPALPGGAFALNKLHDLTEGNDNAQSALLGAAGFGSKLGGADVEPRPNATNFGIRYGNYKPDLFGGDLSLSRIAPRLFTEERISGKGGKYDNYNAITGYKKGSNIKEDAERFLRAQLRPGLPAIIGDYLAGGENYAGEDISLPYDNLKDIEIGDSHPFDIPYSREIASQFLPSYPGDVADAYNVEGPAAALAAGPLGILGFGSNTYDPFAPKKYAAPRKKPAKKSGGSGTGVTYY